MEMSNYEDIWKIKNDKSMQTLKNNPQDIEKLARIIFALFD